MERHSGRHHRAHAEIAKAFAVVPRRRIAFEDWRKLRAPCEINASLTLLDERTPAHHPAAAEFREDALPRLFDLREIWLRVMKECRSELERPVKDDDET